MTSQEKIAFKHSLKKHAIEVIAERMAVARAQMDRAQASANEEEKSSAGDKYETSRAMGHLDKDMHGRRLIEIGKESALLLAINTDILYTSVTQGAFVRCRAASFFVGAGLGKQQIKADTIFFISPLAPLAKSMSQKTIGDDISFGGALHQIIDVF